MADASKPGGSEMDGEASPMHAPAGTLHATVVLVGEAGILIRGRSGAGKSRLARLILAEAAARGLFARLVADDRVRVAARGGRLVASRIPAIAGWIEMRGHGLVRQRSEPARGCPCSWIWCRTCRSACPTRPRVGQSCAASACRGWPCRTPAWTRERC